VAATWKTGPTGQSVRHSLLFDVVDSSIVYPRLERKQNHRIPRVSESLRFNSASGTDVTAAVVIDGLV
jgi:hypothetical protein